MANYRFRKSRDLTTGMGTCEHKYFPNFCGRDKWLVLVYLTDLQSDMHLYCNGEETNPPKNDGIESEFANSSIAGDGHNGSQ